MTDEKQLRKKGENTRKKEEKKEKKANALREHWGWVVNDCSYRKSTPCYKTRYSVLSTDNIRHSI